MMYDVIIIGKGPAGISASLYTMRANLKTLVIAKSVSPIEKAEIIDNYYGFSNGIKGADLVEQGEKQALRLGVEIIRDEVVSIRKEDYFEVFTSNGEYTAVTVLLATGQSYKRLKIGNVEKFIGKGAGYCTTCDGFFYRNLKVGVLGNKDFAVHEAMELTAVTEDITIFTNGMELDLSDEFYKKVIGFKVNKKAVSRLDGNEFLEKICFEDGTEERIDGLFIAYESASSVDFARKLGILTDGNSIVVDKDQRTNLEGLFAAGDCTGGLRQVSVAVGQGAIAGKKIVEYLRDRLIVDKGR